MLKELLPEKRQNIKQIKISIIKWNIIKYLIKQFNCIEDDGFY